MIFDGYDDDEEEEEEEEKEKESEKPSDGLLNRLLKSRTVLVTGEVNQEMAEKVITQLLIMDTDSHDPIRVIITSNGGHVDSGFAIHDVMRYLESEVFTIGAGWVASIAVPILFGARKKENRLSLPNTRFLIHQPSGGALGQAADIRIEAQEILKIRDKLNNMLAEETGQTVDRIAKDSERNYWLSAEEAQEYGIVSRVIKHAGELSRVGN